MDLDSDEFQLKELLVHLEQEHEHLKVSIDHLSNDIVTRELEVRKLLADRQLELTKASAKKSLVTQEHAGERIAKSQSTDFREISRSEPRSDSKFSSEYSKQVSQLLDRIIKTSEEVSALVKL